MRRLVPCLVLALAALAAGCGEPDEPAAPASPDTAVSSPALPAPAGPPADPAACKRLSRRVVGRRLDVAMAMARDRRCALRVVEEDGRSLAVTEDYSESRINVAVTAGRISEMTGLY